MRITKHGVRDLNNGKQPNRHPHQRAVHENVCSHSTRTYVTNLYAPGWDGSRCTNCGKTWEAW